MKVVFIGASKFGLRCLENVIGLPGIDVVGVITNPPSFAISYSQTGVKNVLHRDFHPLAEAHGIPVWNMTTKMTDPALVEQVRAWAPDFILVVGWYHMIPKAIRNIAPTGGLHASLLPDYSGGAPLVWAIINGEEKTGISFFLMDDGVDSGPLIGQAEEPIHFGDTIATLYARIEEAGLGLINRHLPRIADGTVEYTVQDESKRRLVPQRSPQDGQIEWQWPAKRVYDFVRAQTKPYPGAFSYQAGKKIHLWRVAYDPNQAFLPEQAEPGTVLDAIDQQPGPWIVAGDRKVLRLLELDVDGQPAEPTAWMQEALLSGPVRLISLEAEKMSVPV